MGRRFTQKKHDLRLKPKQGNSLDFKQENRFCLIRRYPKFPPFQRSKVTGFSLGFLSFLTLRLESDVVQ
jgi:hypothetical protein